MNKYIQFYGILTDNKGEEISLTIGEKIAETLEERVKTIVVIQRICTKLLLEIAEEE